MREQPTVAQCAGTSLRLSRFGPCRAARDLMLGLLLVIPFVTSCGGGGDLVVPAPLPCNANSKVCYVAPFGSDSNSGADPSVPLATIRRAAQIALSDYTIVVAPGTYREPVTTAETGQAPKRLTFLAQGRVVLDLRNTGSGPGFSLANVDGVVIDGFTVWGANDGGVVLKSGSDGAVIRNCVLVVNNGDGIRVQDSANVLVFNNLIYGNAGIGIRIGGTTAGSPSARLLHNTVYGNGGRGIEIGNSTKASPGALVLNNILQQNGLAVPGQENIKVTTQPPSQTGYRGDYNLVFPASYSPSGAQGIRGVHDINRDAIFADAITGDFRLNPASPAIDAGNPLDDFVDLRRILRARTTTGLVRDAGPLDLGYHFPVS
ncbi:MAG: right-handed parallel beta-helix repeat-containing protein [Candidatus Binatia bacterium]|nr:right-handed parallel beta-helix repeat-containing protein [Candidatus Binatia bacterium]